jgi:esterase FrsA
MSLKDALHKPSAPQLLVNGQKDSQVPIEDLDLVLRSGSAKQAWINPQGGHLGRDKLWSDGRIFSEVIVPWFSQQLK